MYLVPLRYVLISAIIIIGVATWLILKSNEYTVSIVNNTPDYTNEIIKCINNCLPIYIYDNTGSNIFCSRTFQIPTIYDYHSIQAIINGMVHAPMRCHFSLTGFDAQNPPLNIFFEYNNEYFSLTFTKSTHYVIVQLIYNTAEYKKSAEITNQNKLIEYMYEKSNSLIVYINRQMQIEKTNNNLFSIHQDYIPLIYTFLDIHTLDTKDTRIIIANVNIVQLIIEANQDIQQNFDDIKKIFNILQRTPSHMCVEYNKQIQLLSIMSQHTLNNILYLLQPVNASSLNLYNTIGEVMRSMAYIFAKSIVTIHNFNLLYQKNGMFAESILKHIIYTTYIYGTSNSVDFELVESQYIRVIICCEHKIMEKIEYILRINCVQYVYTEHTLQFLIQLNTL